MDEFILNVIKNYYAKFIYFADENSFIRKEVINLFEVKNQKQLSEFINESTILQDNEKIILRKKLKYNEDETEDKISILNYFQVQKNQINHIEILNNILPFNYVNTLVISKSLLSSTGIENFSEFRKKIKDIEVFLYDYSNNKALNNLSIIFIHNNTNSGQYHRIKDTITLKTNSLNPSTLYHEFFHLLDNHLAKKYQLQDLFSNSNMVSKELKLFNEYLDKLDNFIEQEDRSKNTFNLYYKKYLGNNFEKEINSVEDMYSKIRNIKYLEFDIVIDSTKLDNINILAEELFSHIDYIRNGLIKPKRNLFAIFSEIIDLDLPKDSLYIAKKSEKIARIYQSSFPMDKDSLYPLGKEKEILTNQLLYILNKEIKPLLRNENTLSKIIELRESFNSNIKKGRNHAL